MAARHRMAVLRASLAARFHQREWDELAALEAAQTPPAPVAPPPVVSPVATVTTITPTPERASEMPRRRVRPSEDDA